MLPAWATLVLALGGAVIGALAGITGSVLGYRGTIATVRHEELEAWRKVRIEASKALSDSWLELRWLCYLSAEGTAVFDEERSARLEILGTRCAQAVAHAKLVFDPTSEPGRAAKDVDVKVAALKKIAVDADIPWDEDTKTNIAGLIKAAEKAHEEWLKKAHPAIRPESAPAAPGGEH
jgi:hypothetical protein